MTLDEPGTGKGAKPRPVFVTSGAEHDLRGIYRRRLAQRGPDGEDGAEALLERIAKTIAGLGVFPQRGPVPPELEALGIHTFRQFSLPPYRIIYLIEEATTAPRVIVALIADSRRDFRTLLQERLLRTD